MDKKEKEPPLLYEVKTLKKALEEGANEKTVTSFYWVLRNTKDLCLKQYILFRPNDLAYSNVIDIVKSRKDLEKVMKEIYSTYSGFSEPFWSVMNLGRFVLEGCSNSRWFEIPLPVFIHLINPAYFESYITFTNELFREPILDMDMNEYSTWATRSPYLKNGKK